MALSTKRDGSFQHGILRSFPNTVTPCSQHTSERKHLFLGDSTQAEFMHVALGARCAPKYWDIVRAKDEGSIQCVHVEVELLTK